MRHSARRVVAKMTKEREQNWQAQADRAGRDDLMTATEMGRKAWFDGIASAPAMNGKFLAWASERASAAGISTVPYMQAYLGGWMAANLAAPVIFHD